LTLIGLEDIDDLRGAFAHDIIVSEFGGIFINVDVRKKYLATAILADIEFFKERNKTVVLILIFFTIPPKNVIQLTDYLVTRKTSNRKHFCLF